MFLSWVTTASISLQVTFIVIKTKLIYVANSDITESHECEINLHYLFLNFFFTFHHQSMMQGGYYLAPEP